MKLEATQKVLRVLCSMSAVAGAGLVAMGLGAVPVDDALAQVANVWIGKYDGMIPLKPFLVFVGLTKLSSVAKLWGYGVMPSKKLAYIGLGTPAFCAAIGHYKVEGPAASIPPVVYLGLLGALIHLEGINSTPTKRSD